MRKSNLRATAAGQVLALFGAGVFATTPAFAQDTQTCPDGRQVPANTSCTADPTAPPSSETQPSASQQAAVPKPGDQADADDAIVVTGSRIQRPDLEAPSPVTTVGSEQFDLTGTVTVETLLNDLPQLIPGNTRTSNNQGGEDFSTLDLRGLGPQRTLILVDGERVPASSTTGVVDIGTIPAGLIERVDVVTGGASAVYGSDAMAGVVNFILKDNYEGLELSAQYGISDHGDGDEFNVQGLLGGNFGDDRGNLTFFASYYTREAVGQGDRNITRNATALAYDYNSVTGEIYYFIPDYLTPAASYPSRFGANGSVGYVGGGSGTPPASFISNNPLNPFRNLSGVETAIGNPNFNAGVADTNCDGVPNTSAVNGGNLSFNDAGQLTPRNTAGLCAFADRTTGSSRFNFNPLNYLITPYTRWGMAVTGRYDISDSIRLKTVANFVDSSQVVNLAPTPATGLVASTSNPLIPADLRAALNSRTFFTAPNLTSTGTPSGFVEFGSSAACAKAGGVGCVQNSGANRPFILARRFFETGPRVGTTDSKTATIRATLSGPLTAGFNWDVTGSYGRANQTQSLEGNINKTAVAQGLNGCPTTGALPGCQFINIFGPNTLTPSMVNFVALTTHEERRFDQVRVAGNITGNLIELPAGPVGIAIGAEARTDRGDVSVDDAQRTGNIIGFNATQDQHGKVNVKEVYGEVRVPILADRPFFHELSAEAGARYSQYSSVGGLFNYKLGAQYSPTNWLKFRGIYNKAARAPSIVELFRNGDQGFPTYTDFCNQTGRSAGVTALCQAQIVAAGGPSGFDFTGFQQNNSQVQAFAFGNPNLSEETANTFTIGAVLTPNLGTGRFSATVDYYDIKITDLVTTLGAGFYINACKQSLDVNSDACRRIVRNPTTGQIDSVNTSIANQGTLRTKGVDLSLNYAVPFADLGVGVPGRIRLQSIASYLASWKFNGNEYKGTTGGGIGGTFPQWKATTTLGYDSDSFTAQLRWNWQHRVRDIAQCNLPTDKCAPTVPGLSYFDLSLRKKIGDHFELTGIVDNLFNQKAHKTVAGFGAEGGTDIAYWNPVILGRFFTIQAKVKM